MVGELNPPCPNSRNNCEVMPANAPQPTAALNVSGKDAKVTSYVIHFVTSANTSVVVILAPNTDVVESFKSTDNNEDVDVVLFFDEAGELRRDKILNSSDRVMANNKVTTLATPVVIPKEYRELYKGWGICEKLSLKSIESCTKDGGYVRSYP